LVEPDPGAGFRLGRVAAAYVLGEIGAATDEDEAEAALAGVVVVLIRVAGDSVESQPLRSYCIEALTGIGPPARSAIPVLERILRDNTADEDLRNFA
jgi:HEAT repeat protein